MHNRGAMNLLSHLCGNHRALFQDVVRGAHAMASIATLDAGESHQAPDDQEN